MARSAARVSEVHNPSMASRRLLTLGPDNEPVWVRLYVHEIEGVWAAMIVANGDRPPKSGQLKGLAFFGATSEESEREAKTYLGAPEPEN